MATVINTSTTLGETPAPSPCPQPRASPAPGRVCACRWRSRQSPLLRSHSQERRNVLQRDMLTRRDWSFPFSFESLNNFLTFQKPYLVPWIPFVVGKTHCGEKAAAAWAHISRRLLSLEADMSEALNIFEILFEAITPSTCLAQQSLLKISKATRPPRQMTRGGAPHEIQ